MKGLFFKLFSLMVVAMMALTACGSPATATPAAPAATQPAAAPAATATVAAPTAQPLSGTINISGAFALYPMMTVWAAEFTKLNPGVQFNVQAGGAGKGMTDALAGAVDIGMVSRAIQPAEEAKGAYWVSVAKDAVFPVISAQNPVLADLMAKGISPAMFKKIFITGEVTTWGEVVGKPDDTDAIHLYTRSDSAGAADEWALFCGGKVQADILKTAIGVNGEPALVATVIKDPLGITYSNLNSVFDVTSGNIVTGAAVPPIDVNGTGQITPDEVYKTTADAVNAVSSGKYPSPPARFENLVTKGKPTGVVQAFIVWILTDGQKDLGQAGYVALTPDQQAAALAKAK
ncbi:MAG TPA: substrate-binding domain-containing protein [Anaerolineales bacterium]|nr:substrate-binding domain-containing protein [Anaerolineales bacterium]